LAQQFGALDEAERELGRALELEPSSLDYLFALADHYLKRGRPADALPLAERMIEAHPEQRIGHDVKSFAEGRLEGAGSP
jgi:tetratricopeptide (TPR) repeat protein